MVKVFRSEVGGGFCYLEDMVIRKRRVPKHGGHIPLLQYLVEESEGPTLLIQQLNKND
jgi:hypothetical protein